MCWQNYIFVSGFLQLAVALLPLLAAKELLLSLLTVLVSDLPKFSPGDPPITHMAPCHTPIPRHVYSIGTDLTVSPAFPICVLHSVIVPHILLFCILIHFCDQTSLNLILKDKDFFFAIFKIILWKVPLFFSGTRRAGTDTFALISPLSLLFFWDSVCQEDPDTPLLINLLELPCAIFIEKHCQNHETQHYNDKLEE